VKKAMRDVAFDPRAKKDRESLLKLLKAFGKPKKVLLGPELSELETIDTQQEQDDYQAYIRALYASLASHCLCPRKDGRKEITANLRLNSCCTPGELADSVNFRLFFLDHPHDLRAEEEVSYRSYQAVGKRAREQQQSSFR
jgi:hypothetical protein